MYRRTQSPSSINTYKQCPRKYYYRYIKRLPTSPSIHLVRGTIAHSVLEHFFDNMAQVSPQWEINAQFHLLSLFKRFWNEHRDELESLGLPESELAGYKEETRLMLIRWLSQFCNDVSERISAGETFKEAFSTLTPQREERYQDDDLGVMGFIDAIEVVDDTVTLLDYKTSKKPVISPEYRLQLGIYALMYMRRHSRLPEYVGIHFLRHDKQLMEVNNDLLLDAQFEIEQIHMLTQTKDMMHYPKNPSPLCNWCDYYELCFPQKT